ncbi:MAG: uracil phosphoribosyltransferase [Alphaproteobacteria bacterium]|nr:MAG: uracil phosphoribosyltransferase [Alphaproteobacteria bacterium]
MQNVYMNTHPIVQDRLTRLRDKGASPQEFRSYLNEIAMFLVIDATCNLPISPTIIETPVAQMEGAVLDDTSNPLIVPILRAGLAFSDTMSRILPHADTGHIGLCRDPETHEPVEYLVRLPKNLDRPIFVVDPMLATGGSMIGTLDILIARGVDMKNIKIITLVCAPEGIASLRVKYPTLDIYTAAVDSHLNDHAYIVPGLGDAGDRYFGTEG